MKGSLVSFLLRVGWAPVAVFVFHALYAHFIGHPPWLDLLMHPLGGLAIAFAAHTALPRLPAIFGELNRNAHSLLVLGIAFIVANLWEFLEFASDQFLGTTVQSSVTETMIDLVLGTGAATLWVLWAHFFPVRPSR